MIRDFQIADLLTLSNAFMGTISILCVMKFLETHDRNFLWGSFAALPFALVFDVFDGRVARWREETSLLGQELDSLADAVSFGVAPAALAFAMGMRGLWDCAVLVYFVGCGISRLARYNATAAQLSDGAGKVKYFEGTPIPSSLLLVGVLALVAWKSRAGLPGGVVALGPGDFHPLVLMYAASGSAMISKTLHIPKP